MPAIPDFLVRIVVTLAGRWPWLNNKITDLAVNSLVKRGPNRPHPWSTRHDYVSWSGLTDRRYYARLLPADRTFPETDAVGTRRPPTANVATLFLADGAQRPCPKSTCLFAAFAQYLTDGFIRTKLDNNDALSLRDQTTSNHDIDLSQLYGRSVEQTQALRLGSETTGERGRLRSQMIGSEEYSPWLYRRDGSMVDPAYAVLDAPLGIDHAKPAALPTLFAVGGDRVNAAPQTAMINTLFLREHNRLATMIEANNPGWDDERVFQTARNVVIVMFIKIVVEDYINHINSTRFRLRALPEVGYRSTWNRPNWITVEFALLYRWHSLIPQQMSWGGTTYNGNDTLLNNQLLLDAGLARAFVDVSSNGATELGLQNSATFLQGAEFKAIEMGRFNHLASFNDYCRAMGKSVPKDMDDLVGVGRATTAAENSRRQTLATKLTSLYGSIDNVEFYVGLFAEPRVANGPLPDLINSMVAMDAFSQALTNPLLSEHVWGDPTTRAATFTPAGVDAITATETLRQVLERNSTDLGRRFVGMTKPNWKRV